MTHLSEDNRRLTALNDQLQKKLQETTMVLSTMDPTMSELQEHAQMMRRTIAVHQDYLKHIESCIAVREQEMRVRTQMVSKLNDTW
jgi:tRNA A58 N-methylase Trm61